MALWGMMFASLLLCGLAAIAQDSQPGTPEKFQLKGGEIKVPMPEAGDAGLQVFIAFPARPGKYPLVLMTHGASYGKTKNEQMGPGLLEPQALWFARRGWFVAIVVRRGYGASGGKMDKAHFGCDEAAYAAIAEEDAKDLTAVYNYLKDQPRIDATRVLATGSSAGGFASLALGAYAPPGLKAVINFSGGWHSMFFSGSCTKEGLVPEFAALGKATQVPTLWLYAKNDSLFGPKYVSQVYQAYTEAGGQVELKALGKSGDDGHYLFAESQSMWAPLVEDFLARHDLPWKDLAAQEVAPAPKLPGNFPPDIQDAFAKFANFGPYGAFAVSRNGSWGYSTGRKTAKLAADEALDRCRSSDCKVIATTGR